MRLRFPLAALLAVLVALPASAQRPAFLDGMQALTGRPASGPIARRGGDLGEPFTGVLRGSKEVPANTSTARGYAYGLFDASDNSFSVFAPIAGLQGTFQAAHIHSGAAGVNGSVLYPASFVFEDGPNVEIEFNVTLTDPQVVQLQAGNLYINVHSSAFPNGEVRAQFVASDLLNDIRTQPVGSTVSTLAYVPRAKGRASYLNDGTGGIGLFQPSGPFFEAIQSGEIRNGTVVRVTGTTSEFAGQLQISPTSFEVAQVLSENVNRFVETVTLEELAADAEALESVLIAVLDVTIDGGAGGVFTASSNHTTADGSSPAQPIAIRVPGAGESAVPGRPIPTGPTTVLGIASQFADATQILVIESYDVAPTAQVQVIHNAADPALATIRLVAGETEVVPSLSFRQSTGRIDLPALTFGDLVATDASGTPLVQSFNTLFPGEAPVVLVLQGVLDASQFAPNPDFAFIDADFFDLGPIPAPAAGMVRVVAVHGATDAPTIDLRTNNTVLVDDAQYGDVARLDVAPATIPLTVTTATGSVSIGSFRADLTALSGQSVIVLASGFSNPAANQNGPAFRLLAVREDGTATLFPFLNTSAEDGPGTEALSVSAVANPVRTQTAVRYTVGAAGPARLAVVDVLGREVAVLASGDTAAGAHEATLRTEALAPGVYTLRLVSGDRIATSRVTVVR